MKKLRLGNNNNKTTKKKKTVTKKKTKTQKRGHILLRVTDTNWGVKCRISSQTRRSRWDVLLWYSAEPGPSTVTLLSQNVQSSFNCSAIDTCCPSTPPPHPTPPPSLQPTHLFEPWRAGHLHSAARVINWPPNVCLFSELVLFEPH